MDQIILNFRAQLGCADHPSLPSPGKRHEYIREGHNPYVTWGVLDPNSPVFFDRRQELQKVLDVLSRTNKPGNVSLLGERRFGKSSFLDQVYGALAAEPNLLSIFAATQDWTNARPESFFGGLHLAILSALEGTRYVSQQTQRTKVKGKVNAAIRDYEGLRSFIKPLAEQGIRFVLILDEFTGIAKIKEFDTNFYSNLRILGERAEYRFGYLISSGKPLNELCPDALESTPFWGIFRVEYLGLLNEQDARDLVIEPLIRSLPESRQPDLENLWARDIAPLTGCHPALIQMVLAQRWCSWFENWESNQDQLEVGLRGYLEALWTDRRDDEQTLLFLAATGQVLDDSEITRDLRLRGLVTADHHPLSPLFTRVILELAPPAKRFAETAKRLQVNGKRASETLDAVLDALEKAARRIGLIWKSFKNAMPAGEDPKDGEK